MTVKSQLLDATNFEQHAFGLISKIKVATFVGLDTETQDSNRHEGLNTYCKYNPKTGKKAENTKMVFDIRRTVMTGFSIWVEGDDTAYYVNLNHADIENRIPWSKAKILLDALPAESFWVAHNAAYELTVFKACYDLDIPNYICTLQLAVSAFGPDEYHLNDFIRAGQGEIRKLIPSLLQESRYYDPAKGNDLPPALADVVYKIIGKASTSTFSYNGFVKDIAYSYGLKKLVKAFFQHQMTTFQEVLGDKVHMGELTGAEVCAYGSDDAYWAVRLFRRLMEYMAKNCPATIPTFFSQENPMVQKFSNIWIGGMVVNTTNVFARRDLERSEMANILRKMKVTVRKMLPFSDTPSAVLRDEKWYQPKYREQIIAWAAMPDSDDDFTQCQQVRGPVSNAWGDGRNTGPNFSHYMPMRVLLYDLINTKAIRSEGKIQSDGEARGKLKDRLRENADAVAIIDAINEIAGVEQRMKLYLTPYTQLMDPETGKMYPLVSSMLATRRMAGSVPNVMQLAKRGESTYVRGFFEPDYADHVLVSIDWSGIELVEIGDFSADPEFIKAFGQIPHQDLHAGAAADILSVDVPGLTEDIFKSLKDFKSEEEFVEHYGQDMANTNRLFTDLKGQDLSIDKAYKYWRTEVGKGANFNYWYSGFLGTIGERMGWSTEKTGKATERYRERFHVAERWRTDLIAEVQQNGFITLPDGHRRVRFEATHLWNDYFCSKFQYPVDRDDDQLTKFNSIISWIARKIQKRAHNQAVNAYIQGSCATIAKRSIIRIDNWKADQGWADREARFLMPIHDELLYSVHKSIVPEFINGARGIMIDHPDMFRHCMLDASPSIGLTFEPWNPKNASLGQLELYEMPEIGIGTPGGRASDDDVRGAVEYLFDQRRLAA
ncbi:DNA polymerase [Mesorhizobium sp. STM 4661]|uniref:DNA polymerase n=1 Tax=Mesorhizobium sp. STM 4661 TaxID=1297570 RepID=UPI0002C02951|nr:DNA polymerase [Mesorhizobium sp. STM 4661]CCV12889.1 putative DNA-directed DNA polymerase [Mesorhizobium sp. STM 4661]